MLRRLYLGVVVAGLVAGCAPDIDQQDPPSQSAMTIASFLPDTAKPCASLMPYPSDLIKNQTTGTLDIPFCPEDDAVTVATKIGLRTLDGYSLDTVLYTYFTDDIREGTAVGNTYLLNTTTGQLVSLTPIWNSADKQLLLFPQEQLDPATTYIAAVTSGVKDSKGNDIISDQVFSFLKSSETLVDDSGFSRFASITDEQANQLEPLRQAYVGIFAALAGAQQVSKTRDEILVAWSFTTQAVFGAMSELKEVVTATAVEIEKQSEVAAAAHPFLRDLDSDGYADATGLPIANLDTVYAGTMTVTSLLTNTGTFGLDSKGERIVDRVPIDYMFITPAGCGYAYDHVAVFVHALGRCKNDALALANLFAGLCYATLSLDGPFAGARSVTNLGDQDVDGCPDQPETPEFIALPGESPNPVAVRDHLREWGLELVQIAGAAAAKPEALAGNDSPTATADVALVGHSWGGMAATHAAALSADVDLLVTMASSADLGEVFSPLVRESMAASLTAAGVDINTTAGAAALAAAVQETMVVFLWGLQAGDPLYTAAEVPDTLPVLPLVFDAGGDMADAPLHGTSTQSALSTALGATTSDVTFTFACDDAGTEVAICDDPTAVIAGGMLPCASDSAACAALEVGSGACTLDPDCAPLSATVCGASAYRASVEKLTAIQTVIATFIGSNGASTGTPDSVAACP